MGSLKRHTFPVISGLVLLPLFLAGGRTSVSDLTLSSRDLPAINVQGQLVHAMELASQREIASEGGSVDAGKDQRKSLYQTVKRLLPKKHRDRAFEIARTVIVEANHHMMDPLFLLAVIKTESHFNPKARGRHGEIGLMQILPETAKWLAPQAGLNPAAVDLEDPKTNIRIGATYLASLRKSFSGYGPRYIGAYNMGPRNVRRLMAMNIDPEVYPGKVLKNYRALYEKLESAKPVKEKSSSQKIARN